MGLFDIIKSKITGWGGRKPAVSLNSYTPLFSQYGQSIYASDVVQSAINCIIKEMKKLDPRHVRRDSHGDYIPQHDSIQAVLMHPNEMMTTTDLIEKMVWNLYFNYNSFILPTWDGDNRLTGLYPIQPAQVNFLQDASGKLFVQFQFANGYEATIRYRDVIHVRYNYSVNDYMGGDVTGQPNYGGLLKTLELNHTLLEGVGKALKSSFSVNGIVKYNTLIDEKKMESALTEFSNRLQNNESGLMGIDLKGEFIPITKNVQLVDADTLKFIDEKILRNFGVPLAILTGDYTSEQYSAFYQKTLEPLIITISQAFTKCIFSERESFSYGHRIMFYARELEFLNMNQKIEMIKSLGDRGELYSNEIRTMLGLQPMDELVGQRIMSLNYINAEIADRYQLSRIAGESTDGGEEAEDGTQ